MPRCKGGCRNKELTSKNENEQERIKKLDTVSESRSSASSSLIKPTRKDKKKRANKDIPGKKERQIGRKTGSEMHRDSKTLSSPSHKINST